MTRARIVGVGVVLSGTAAGVLAAMSYAKRQAAMPPGWWEPHFLPADWPIDAFTALCAGWILFALVWALLVARGRKEPQPEPEPPTDRNYVAAHLSGPTRQRYNSRVRRVPVFARQRRKRV